MKNNQKGITLVALVVTIVILIILATVSMTMVLGNNGLINRARQAREMTIEEQQNENGIYGQGEDYINSYLSGKVISTSGETATSTPEETTTPTSGETTTPTPVVTTCEVGQEVIVGGENFYVIESSDESQSTVTLLAKYNLNQAGTLQVPNASQDDTKCVFSNNNYWTSTYNAYTDWSTKKLDINTISGEQSGDAIYKAKQYAILKNGTNGRLLTVEEFDILKGDILDILRGTANQQGTSTTRGLCYWFASASTKGNNYVYSIQGTVNLNVNPNFYYRNGDGNGVRPVITVSKSLVQLVQ